MAITLSLLIPMHLQEIILRQFQHERKQHEQLPHDLEMNVLRKMFDLITVVVYDGRVRVLRGVGGCELRDVVDLRVVLDVVFDCPDAARLVAVVAAMFEVGAVLDLFFRGEVEDLLAQAKLAVNLVLGETEVGDVEETC